MTKRIQTATSTLSERERVTSHDTTGSLALDIWAILLSLNMDLPKA